VADFRILTTGANGFIGSRLIPKLVEIGHDVTALHRYVTGRYVLGENYHTVHASLEDPAGISAVVEAVDPEIVIHLGAISAVSFSYDHPQEVNNVNYMGLINLAESCRTLCSDFKQFISAGTSEEYGNQDYFPIREDATLHPNSPYAVSKAASTMYLEYMRDAYGFPITICRPFNTYGRTENKHFVTERILSQMLDNHHEVRLGDPNPVRDMMFRDDHVDAYLKVLGNADAVGEKINFCTGVGYSIAELVSLCAELTGWKGDIHWHTIPKRPLDIDVLIGDNAKARSLGWVPKYDLKEGLIETIKELE